MAKKEKVYTEAALQKGCVLYVDGGCRSGYADDQHSRYGGWGIHGYTYPIDKIPKTKRTKKDTPTINGYLVGDQVPHEHQVEVDGYIDAYGSMGNHDASDRAELTGFYNAIQLIKEQGYKQAHLLLDNQYVINGVNELYPKWCSMNWTKPNGDKYANRTLWEETMDVYQPLSQDVKFTVSWVNGHSGNLGNDRADYLATKGVYAGRNGKLDLKSVLINPIAKYRDPKPNINRLFAKNRWYFNTTHLEPHQSKDGRYVYHCGAHGSDDTLIGKSMADAVVYTLYLKQPEPVLEAVRRFHMEKIDNPLNDLCMARLDTLLLPRIYHEIETDGVQVLSIAPRKLNYKGLCTIDNQEATRVIQPSGLTFKLIDVHNFLEHELQRYLDGKARLTDITAYIYQQDTDKKGKVETTMIVTPSEKILRLPVFVLPVGENETPIKHTCPLTIGIDIPSRELLNAIKDRSPKVYVSTWLVSDHAFRYAVIIEAGEDTMIWMGKDSSLQFIYPEEMKRKAKT